MLDKAILALLVATMGSITYTISAQQIEGALHEAQVAASFMQIHELEIALELYHLDTGHYPLVAADELDTELHNAGFIKRASIPFAIEYGTTRNGQSYNLSVAPSESVNIDV